MPRTDHSDPVIVIRDAITGDRDAIIAMDEVVTGSPKPIYWGEVFSRHFEGPGGSRVFLVAQGADALVGFIIGEVRAWEFGSPPCGWVFALNVAPEMRERGIGAQLMDQMCARLKSAKVDTVRTMVSRQDKLTLSFFRSQGLRAGPYVQLEKDLDS